MYVKMLIIIHSLYSLAAFMKKEILSWSYVFHFLDYNLCHAAFRSQ